MLNIDPLLFQPKVIRMSTTSNIGLPGQHIIRTSEYSNSQVMTGTNAQVHNEANNNMLTTNHTEINEDYLPRNREFSTTTGLRDYRNFNEMDTTDPMEPEMSDGEITSAHHPEWSAEMYWSGEGNGSDNSTLERIAQQNSASIMSFQSTLSCSSASTSFHSQLSEQSESKEEVISSLLNKVRSHNKVEASKILLAMSNSVENCIAMRQCGCLPLLIQLLHSPDENSNTYHMVHAKRVNFEIRERASQVLHNIVFSQPDDKKGRREARVLRLLEQIRDYCDQLRNLDVDIDDNRNARCVDQHLGPAVAALMKLSFDEDHRYAMCQLGGLQAIAELLQIDHEIHGCTSDQYCITIRRYSGMALTNLTFGDGANKALLCSMRPFMEALVGQLYSSSEDLRQVTASVLRNLSWRADPASKRMLREVGAVTTLVKAAMEAQKESTLKSILSALWNLSAHCSGNKADICLVDGALAFLVSTLTYNSKSKTLAIVENGGGILRNVSSHIAIQNDYRVILRKHNCLQILLQHLKSPSLTVVSNACGTLWNLSARNAIDQRALWEMGAVGMLKKLINSKHKMISMGSSAALKNLLSAKPPGVSLGLCVHTDSYKCSTDVPSLHVRKQKALSTEIDQNLSETYDNTDSPKTSPVNHGIHDKSNRSRRHISPSARYMTAQKQRNDLLSMQNRGIDDEKLNCTYVVEEKHNGAFQVTKNAKQAMNYRQGQSRFHTDIKDNLHTEEIPHYSADRNVIENNEPTKLTFRPSRIDKQFYPPDSIHSTQNKVDVTPRAVSENVAPQIGVRKDYKAPERITNVAQKYRTVNREDREHSQERVSKQIGETSQSVTPKPFHESKIPLPRSLSKHDTQRSQSASPIAQRRSISQRQEVSHNLNSRNVDITVTHPKYAWNASYEKEDNEPEQPVNFNKRLMKEDNQAFEPSKETRPYKPLASRVLQTDDYSYSSDDEVKVYHTENTPINYSLMSSMNDLEEAGATARCSLNIKTNTNVKLMKNHPLLANASAHRGDDDNCRLFESRHALKDDRYRDFEGGKTVDFSVQSDYDIDETLSMMSRSSSVASISSFDQQSFHDDESFASDLSHRTSGIESPSELSDSPCQTVPSSPQKKYFTNTASSGSGLSDPDQIKSHAIEGAVEATEEAAESVTGKESCSLKAESYFDQSSEGERTKVEKEKAGVTKPESPKSLSPVKQEPVKETKEIQIACSSEESEVAELAAKLADDDYADSKLSLQNASVGSIQASGKENLKSLKEGTQRSSKPGEIEVTNCSEPYTSSSISSSSVSTDIIEDISPTERDMLEQCIRAGLPQRNLEQNQGARQKIPQSNYQMLRDTVERHPKACSYDTERGHLLRDIEVKESEYESLSENEEKGKEDERKAEKNRLFRIPESPVDKKVYSLAQDSNKKAYIPPEDTEGQFSEHPDGRSLKFVVDQKGNRRCEKYQSHQDRSKAAPIPSQLDFLMSNKKNGSSSESKVNSGDTKKSFDSESKVLQSEKTAELEECRTEKRSFSDDQTEKDVHVEAYVQHEKDIQCEADIEKPGEKTTVIKLTNLEFLDKKSNFKEYETNLQDKTISSGKGSDENFEKDIDCCEKENNVDPEDCMLTSSILCEAREIAEALLGARVDSTEDMTVSTLSCLSDIDNARPPSVMGELGSLSMTNSSASEENLKLAVAKECQKLFGKGGKQVSSSKKSLLRELQMVRLNSNDNSKGSNESPENLSMKSSSASDLLGNVNPPSIIDDISLTTSTGSLNGIEGSDSECEQERNLIAPYSSKQDSLSERMHDAAAMAQLYAKELSNITGNGMKESNSTDALSRMKMPTVMQEVMEVTIADATEIGCDTIGSDTELEDDLPCDDEDPGSDTLQAPCTNSLSKDEPGDGSTENLTLTLTEEPSRPDVSPYFEFKKHSGCFMSADDFRALQENADRILNTLKDVEISDEEDAAGMSNGDMLEDETMSLVSNESDEEFLSPDGTVHHAPKCSPRNDYLLSPTLNGMVGLPQSSSTPSQFIGRKTSLPQVAGRNKSLPSGLPKSSEMTARNRYSYPEAGTESRRGQTSDFSDYSGSPKKIAIKCKTNQNKIKAPVTNKKPGTVTNIQVDESQMQNVDFGVGNLEEGGAFDSRTFTRKKSTVPKGMIPSIQTTTLKSPSAITAPSFPVSSDNANLSKTSEPCKTVGSKIASVWKNTGKTRSKSAVDANRNSKLRLEKSASTGSSSSSSSRDEEKISTGQLQRPSSQTSSPKSPLSRSSTYEKLNDEECAANSSIRRPNSLALSQKSSPRHMKALPVPQRSYAPTQKLTSEVPHRPRTVAPKTEDSKKYQPSDGPVLSPTSHQSNIPKMQGKAQASLIPSRRSMIPTPAKFGVPEN